MELCNSTCAGIHGEHNLGFRSHSTFSFLSFFSRCWNTCCAFKITVRKRKRMSPTLLLVSWHTNILRKVWCCQHLTNWHHPTHFYSDHLWSCARHHSRGSSHHCDRFGGAVKVRAPFFFMKNYNYAKGGSPLIFLKHVFCSKAKSPLRRRQEERSEKKRLRCRWEIRALKCPKKSPQLQEKESLPAVFVSYLSCRWHKTYELIVEVQHFIATRWFICHAFS